MLDDDVAGLSGSLRSNDPLSRDDLTRKRGLVLGGVDGDGGLIPVRGGLEEVLLGAGGGVKGGAEVEGREERL